MNKIGHIFEELHVKDGINERDFEGENYDPNLSSVDIARNIRRDLKKIKGTKWSVRKKRYGNIAIYLIEAPYEIFDRRPGDLGYGYDVNHHWLDRDSYLNRKGKELIKRASGIASSYRYDNSNPQVDLYDTNFHYDIKIGKEGKPFKVVGGRGVKKSKKEFMDEVPF